MNKHRCTTGNNNLSSLARGRGLLDGGVEVECFTNDTKAFSLTGQRLICESNSKEGVYSKPYKPHRLTMPKTYVTRKGQMVLFTAPEDMVLGQACQLHYREVTARETARELKSSQKLVKSALDYEGQRGKEIKIKSAAWMKDEEVKREETGEKGFRADLAKVYLNSLQKAAEKARQLSQDSISVEDMEVAEQAVDSGLGTPKLRPVSSVDSGLGSYQVSSAQVPSSNSRPSRSLLDEPDMLGPAEDDISKLQTELLNAYKSPPSKVNKKKSPRSRKGSKGKGGKTNSKGSPPTRNSSTQKDDEWLSSKCTRKEGMGFALEHVDSGAVIDMDHLGEGEAIGVSEGVRLAEEARRLMEEEARRLMEEEARRLMEEEARRLMEEEARRQREEEARRQREMDEQRKLDERLKEEEDKQKLARLQAEERARRERMNAELADQRYSQSLSRSFYFSYFTHVPQNVKQSTNTDKRKPKPRKKN